MLTCSPQKLEITEKGAPTRKHGFVVSPSWRTGLRAARPRRWSARPKRSLLGADVDVRVTIRSGQTDVAEPTSDHVDLDSGLVEVHRRRVAKNVRPYRAVGRTSLVKARSVPSD